VPAAAENLELLFSPSPDFIRPVNFIPFVRQAAQQNTGLPVVLYDLWKIKPAAPLRGLSFLFIVKKYISG